MSTYIYGFHALRARISQAVPGISAVWINLARKDKRTQSLIDQLQAKSIKVERVTTERFAQLLAAAELPMDAVHQGVLALLHHEAASAMNRSFDDWLLHWQKEERVLLLLLDGVTDPHNLGACLRVANAAGASAVIAAKHHSAPLHASTRKVASGAAELTPYLQVTNLVRSIESLKECGFTILALDERGEQSLFVTPMASHCAFLLGAEGAGLRRLSREHCDQLLSIPMYGGTESLNVASATTLCLYEWCRKNQA